MKSFMFHPSYLNTKLFNLNKINIIQNPGTSCHVITSMVGKNPYIETVLGMVGRVS